MCIVVEASRRLEQGHLLPLRRLLYAQPAAVREESPLSQWFITITISSEQLAVPSSSLRPTLRREHRARLYTYGSHGSHRSHGPDGPDGPHGIQEAEVTRRGALERRCEVAGAGGGYGEGLVARQRGGAPLAGEGAQLRRRQTPLRVTPARQAHGRATVQEEARRVGVARGHDVPAGVERSEGAVARREEPGGRLRVVEVVRGALRRERRVGVQQVEVRIVGAQEAVAGRGDAGVAAVGVGAGQRVVVLLVEELQRLARAPGKVLHRRLGGVEALQPGLAARCVS